MQGLVDFANQIGEVFGVLVPTLCYLAALFCFLFAVWGFWMQSHPQNPFFGRPWIPFVSLVLCGVFASFDKIPEHGACDGRIERHGVGHVAVELFAAVRAERLGDAGGDPERDARQYCDGVSGVLSEFWRVWWCSSRSCTGVQ